MKKKMASIPTREAWLFKNKQALTLVRKGLKQARQGHTASSKDQLKSDKEAAEFWDTHSLADFDKELHPAKNIVFTKPERQG